MKVQTISVVPGLAGKLDSSRAPTNLREPVLLIHGTAANRRSGDGGDWWHPGSAFCHDLDALLQNAGASARCWANPGHNEPPFAWTGENSEIARREAGRALAERLTALEDDAGVGRYHLVGHSHGGNVMVNALHTMSRKPGKLGAVIFLGTPALTFRHAQAFDERWLSIPLYLAALAGAAYEIVQPGDNRFLWVPVIIVVLLAVCAELLRPKPPARRADAELYGSGSPSAFAFAGDEAITALLSAQQIAREPKRFIEQFTQTKPPPPFAFTPTPAAKNELGDSLERTGAYTVMRWLKLDPSAPAAAPVPLSMPHQYATGQQAPAAGPHEILRNASGAVDTLFAAYPMWKPMATIALWALALLPFIVLMSVGFVVSLLSWCASVLLRSVVLRGAKRLGRTSLPILVRKAAFGADDGKFLAVSDLPPGVATLEPIPKDLLREVIAVGGQVGTEAGQAVLGAVARTDVFAIKTQVEDALSNTALVHSYYYRSSHVQARIAQLIAQPAKQWPEPFFPWLGLLRNLPSHWNNK